MDFGLTLRVFFVVDQMAVLLMHLHSLRYFLQYQACDGIFLYLSFLCFLSQIYLMQTQTQILQCHFIVFLVKVMLLYYDKRFLHVTVGHNSERPFVKVTLNCMYFVSLCFLFFFLFFQNYLSVYGKISDTNSYECNYAKVLMCIVG